MRRWGHSRPWEELEKKKLKWVTSMLTSCHLGQTSSFNLKVSCQGHHGDMVACLSAFVHLETQFLGSPGRLPAST